MQTRHASLFDRVVTFDEIPGPSSTSGSRGAGVASSAWLTSDGVVVLNPNPTVGSGFRRRRIADVADRNLDDAVPRLGQILTTGGGPVLARARSEKVLDAVVAVAAELGFAPESQAVERELWIAADDVETLARQRTRTSARLVDWAPRSVSGAGMERRTATLHGYGIDVLAMQHHHWSAGSVAMCHRFGIMSYGWGCEHEREMAVLVDNGIDAVQSGYGDRLAAVVAQYR